MQTRAFISWWRQGGQASRFPWPRRRSRHRCDRRFSDASGRDDREERASAGRRLCGSARRRHVSGPEVPQVCGDWPAANDREGLREVSPSPAEGGKATSDPRGANTVETLRFERRQALPRKDRPDTLSARRIVTREMRVFPCTLDEVSEQAHDVIRRCLPYWLWLGPSFVAVPLIEVCASIAIPCPSVPCTGENRIDCL